MAKILLSASRVPLKGYNKTVLTMRGGEKKPTGAKLSTTLQRGTTNPFPLKKGKSGKELLARAMRKLAKK